MLRLCVVMADGCPVSVYHDDTKRKTLDVRVIKLCLVYQTDSFDTKLKRIRNSIRKTDTTADEYISSASSHTI